MGILSDYLQDLTRFCRCTAEPSCRLCVACRAGEKCLLLTKNCLRITTRPHYHYPELDPYQPIRRLKRPLIVHSIMTLDVTNRYGIVRRQRAKQQSVPQMLRGHRGGHRGIRHNHNSDQDKVVMNSTPTGARFGKAHARFPATDHHVRGTRCE